MEAGKGEVERARSTTRLRLGFEYVDGDPRLSQRDRGSEAVGPCADYTSFDDSRPSSARLSELEPFIHSMLREIQINHFFQSRHWKAIQWHGPYRPPSARGLERKVPPIFGATSGPTIAFPISR